MHRLSRWAPSVLLAALVLGAGGVCAPARAQDEAKPLIIGANRVLTIRTADTLNGREWSVQDRINHVQDVMPKYLGGPFGKITWKKWGERIHLYLNGDFLLAVTPADARATGYKNAEQLAPIWAAGVQRGFDLGRTWTRNAPQ